VNYLIRSYDGPGTHAPVVYFAAVDSLVKIGTTRNLAKRTQDLGIRIEAVRLLLDGGHSLESEMHHSFTEQRIARTEWFHHAGPLAEFIASPGDVKTPLDRAEEIVEELRFASASMLKRRMRISWPRAAQLMDGLESRGVVGVLPSRGSTRQYLYPWMRAEDEES